VIMDCCFKTKEEARKLNELHKRFWRYSGIAKTPHGYVAWRTNSTKQVRKLLQNSEFDEVEVEEVEVEENEQG